MDLLPTLPDRVALYEIPGIDALYLSPGAALTDNNMRASQIRRTTYQREHLYNIIANRLCVDYDYKVATIRSPVRFEDWLSPTARSILLQIQTSHLKRDCSFVLERSKCHGPPHWLRVSYWGIKLLMKQIGIQDITIPNTVGILSSPQGEFISCFAVLHDLFRITDDDDPAHGRRTVQYLLSDQGLTMARQIEQAIGRPNMEAFLHALRDHSYGGTTTDLFVGLCWDADRLDLTRTFEIPSPALLSTVTARESLWTL
jgi:uncharacterized protein